MTDAKTLLQLSGADLNPPDLADSNLVLIDYQNEYRAGPLALPDVDAAIAAGARLLAQARRSGANIFHVAHKGKSGGLFDRGAERGAIVASVAPGNGEPVIEKPLPNAFAGTVPEEVKQERWDRLMAAQKDVSRERARAKVGRTIDVIIDAVDAKGAVGRSKWDAPEIDGRVFVRGATARVPGDLIRAKVYRSDAYDLWAELAPA